MSNRTYTQEELRSTLAAMGVADATSVERYGSGHINDTFKVETSAGPRFILQRVTDAFDKDVLKENIIRVTDHLKNKGVKTLEVVAYENPWRIYKFLEGYESVDVISEPSQAELAAGAFVQSAMQVVFLLNNAYMPYYKWQFRTLRGLERLSLLAEVMEYLLTTGNDGDTAAEKQKVIEGIAADVIAALKSEGLTRADCDDLEKHAYSVNDAIADAQLRNMHVLAAV